MSGHGVRYHSQLSAATPHDRQQMNANEALQHAAHQAGGGGAAGIDPPCRMHWRIAQGGSLWPTYSSVLPGLLVILSYCQQQRCRLGGCGQCYRQMCRLWA